MPMFDSPVPRKPNIGRPTTGPKPPAWLSSEQWSSLSPEAQKFVSAMQLRSTSDTTADTRGWLEKLLAPGPKVGARYLDNTIYLDPEQYGTDTALHETLHGLQESMGIRFSPAPALQARGTSLYGVSPTLKASWDYMLQGNFFRSNQAFDAWSHGGHINTNEQFAVLGQAGPRNLTGSTLGAYRQVFSKQAIAGEQANVYAQHRGGAGAFTGIKLPAPAGSMAIGGRARRPYLPRPTTGPTVRGY